MGLMFEIFSWLLGTEQDWLKIQRWKSVYAISWCWGPLTSQAALQQTACRYAADSMDNSKIQECHIYLAALCPSQEGAC